MKKIVSIFLVVFCLGLFSAPGEAFSASAPVSITAPSAVLYDLRTGRLLYSKDPYRKRAPASTTKILTAMVASDMLSLDKVVTVPSFAHGIEPSKIYLKAGEKYRVRDLIRATLISSANDAAEVLAHAASGSVPAFAKKMNEKARKIGCKHSHFIRPSGLPAKGQYATAYDMTMIMKYAEKYSFIVETLKEKYRTIYSVGGRKITLKNHNKMLWKENSGVVGKTGWTRSAKHCFVGHLGFSSNRVLISIMGSHSLWRDIQRLLDFQYGNAYAKIRKNRKIWSTAETKKIQTALKKAGFDPGPVDGIFGSKTVRAAESFQKAKGLATDGIVGTLTWNKLKRYL